MDKRSKEVIRNRYYNLGAQAAIQESNIKTAANIKDIVKSIGRGASYTLPTVGALTGLAGGGYIGGKTGLNLAEAIAETAVKGGDPDGAIASMILGGALFGGAGLGVGGALGGIGGHRLGTSAKESLLQALLKK